MHTFLQKKKPLGLCSPAYHKKLKLCSHLRCFPYTCQNLLSYSVLQNPTKHCPISSLDKLFLYIIVLFSQGNEFVFSCFDVYKEYYWN